MSNDTKNKGIEASLKSMDTEEFIDIHFYRPIGYRWALLFQKLGVHPNVVTIASIFIGVAAGVMFYFDNLKLNIIGMLLLIWANSYDSADGQLARLTGQKTQWGRMLDGFAGDLWFFSIYFFICLRFTVEHNWDVEKWQIVGVWLLAAFSGFICHSKQCALADYYRNIHLFFLKGKEGSELDNFKQQRELLYSTPWKNHFWWKIWLFFYGNYTRSQESMSPNFQRFMTLVKEKYGDSIPQSLRDEFRALSKPLMKYSNILTFNTRAIALFVCLFIGMPWLYFIFEITVMNVLFFYMRYRHEKISALLYNQLKSK
ncbi:MULTISPECIES: CDP-alcohol phosphatidyltransferase family protein [unclassified Bacteroides]|jgi:phosphatidylglycerophosphate synthase|uniref:CDP-alcohol phosphatidyltransferase family protein n=1 Tax=unclassified Bacteroides TaxID=2646097 RepID=UPI000E97F84D|nr:MULTISPECIES: CDP-alcohol phosphatidyltransferase family protein [unclassified Bacteroides]RGN50315.1 CDP-alcohol phosphatidyltransferase family protein [Bacteroides sp. OM05-12]RHR76900.1 CDP-alcohol phosphatidyltransferase family protein [Bacteroides sp. AF16-49]